MTITVRRIRVWSKAVQMQSDSTTTMTPLIWIIIIISIKESKRKTNLHPTMSHQMNRIRQGKNKTRQDKTRRSFHFISSILFFILKMLHLFHFTSRSLVNSSKKSNTEEKPPYSYVALIAMAIEVIFVYFSPIIIHQKWIIVTNSRMYFVHV